mmetsp:Transcript_826/g.2661  ORF Transcript_826/g.2661 Transcript_826/m.2661 type:complete len:1295 (-) Transcript_826:91-3975(-)
MKPTRSPAPQGIRGAAKELSEATAAREAALAAGASKAAADAAAQAVAAVVLREKSKAEAEAKSAPPDFVMQDEVALLQVEQHLKVADRKHPTDKLRSVAAFCGGPKWRQLWKESLLVMLDNAHSHSPTPRKSRAHVAESPSHHPRYRRANEARTAPPVDLNEDQGSNRGDMHSLSEEDDRSPHRRNRRKAKSEKVGRDRRDTDSEERSVGAELLDPEERSVNSSPSPTRRAKRDDGGGSRVQRWPIASESPPRSRRPGRAGRASSSRDEVLPRGKHPAEQYEHLRNRFLWEHGPQIPEERTAQPVAHEASVVVASPRRDRAAIKPTSPYSRNLIEDHPIEAYAPGERRRTVDAAQPPPPAAPPASFAPSHPGRKAVRKKKAVAAQKALQEIYGGRPSRKVITEGVRAAQKRGRAPVAIPHGSPPRARRDESEESDGGDSRHEKPRQQPAEADLLAALHEVPRARREHLLQMLEGMEQQLLGKSIELPPSDVGYLAHAAAANQPAAGNGQQEGAPKAGKKKKAGKAPLGGKRSRVVSRPMAAKRLIDKLADAVAKDPKLRKAAEAARGSSRRMILSPERLGQRVLSDIGVRLSSGDVAVLSELLDPHGSLGGSVDFWKLLSAHVVPALQARERKAREGVTVPPAGAAGAEASVLRVPQSEGQQTDMDAVELLNQQSTAVAGGSGGTRRTAPNPAAPVAASPVRDGESVPQKQHEAAVERAVPRPARVTAVAGQNLSPTSMANNGMGRREDVKKLVADMAKAMDKHTAPELLQGGQETQRASIQPMGLYDLQRTIENEVGLLLTLTQVQAMAKCFSARADRLVVWSEFVDWFWLVGNEAKATDRKVAAQDSFLRAHSRGSIHSAGGDPPPTGEAEHCAATKPDPCSEPVLARSSQGELDTLKPALSAPPVSTVAAAGGAVKGKENPEPPVMREEQDGNKKDSARGESVDSDYGDEDYEDEAYEDEEPPLVSEEPPPSSAKPQPVSKSDEKSMPALSHGRSDPEEAVAASVALNALQRKQNMLDSAPESQANVAPAPGESELTHTGDGAIEDPPQWLGGDSSSDEEEAEVAQLAVGVAEEESGSVPVSLQSHLHHVAATAGSAGPAAALAALDSMYSDSEPPASARSGPGSPEYSLPSSNDAVEPQHSQSGESVPQPTPGSPPDSRVASPVSMEPVGNTHFASNRQGNKVASPPTSPSDSGDFRVGSMALGGLAPAQKIPGDIGASRPVAQPAAGPVSPPDSPRFDFKQHPHQHPAAAAPPPEPGSPPGSPPVEPELSEADSDDEYEEDYEDEFELE